MPLRGLDLTRAKFSRGLDIPATFCFGFGGDFGWTVSTHAFVNLKGTRRRYPPADQQPAVTSTQAGKIRRSFAKTKTRETQRRCQSAARLQLQRLHCLIIRKQQGEGRECHNSARLAKPKTTFAVPGPPTREQESFFLFSLSPPQSPPSLGLKLITHAVWSMRASRLAAQPYPKPLGLPPALTHHWAYLHCPSCTTFTREA